MARLPSGRYLIQMSGEQVTLIDDVTGEEIFLFTASDAHHAAKAQLAIHQLPGISDEDRSFLHFWSGYFYAHGSRPGQLVNGEFTVVRLD